MRPSLSLLCFRLNKPRDFSSSSHISPSRPSNRFCCPSCCSPSLPRYLLFKHKAAWCPMEQPLHDAHRTQHTALWAPPNTAGKVLPKSAQQLADLKLCYTLQLGLLTHVNRDEAVPFLLFCFPDHNCRLDLFLFSVGEKLLQKQRQEMRLLPCIQVSLPCFDKLSVPPRAIRSASQCLHSTLPTLQRCWEEKYIKDYDRLSCYANKDLLKCSVYDWQ